MSTTILNASAISSRSIGGCFFSNPSASWHWS